MDVTTLDLSHGPGGTAPHHSTLSDQNGLVAVIAGEEVAGGGWFEDPDDRSDSWTIFSVVWCRSGTLPAGAFRSSCFDATCAATLRWEHRLTRDMPILARDVAVARERAELACIEYDRLTRVRPEASVAALKRVVHFASEANHLASELRSRLREFQVSEPLPTSRPAPTLVGTNAGLVRQGLVHDAVAAMSESGVAVEVPADIVSSVVALQGLTTESAEALWTAPGDMRAEMLVALARSSLQRRGDDRALVTIWDFLAANTSLLVTPERRQVLLRKLIALVARHIDDVTASMEWRNHIVCSMAVGQPPSRGSAMARQLAQEEGEFMARLARFTENALAQTGFRLKPILRQNHECLVAAVTALMDGLGIVRRTMALAYTAPLGADAGDRTFTVVVLTALLDDLIEPDPEFDADRAVQRLTHGLTSEIQRV